MIGPRVLITNWESADNLGDYAILRAQVDFLERRLSARVRLLGNQPGVVFPSELEGRHCGDAPWVSPWRGGAAGWARGFVCCMLMLIQPQAAGLLPRRYRRLHECFRCADLVMPEGGGYYLADRSFRKAMFLLRTLYPLLLARRMGVPRAVWGHSIGPVRGLMSKAMLRVALRGASIEVRDDASLALCRELGLPAGRTPDFALLTKSSETLSPRVAIAGGGRRSIGVTAKRISSDGALQQRYIDAMVAGLESIASSASVEGAGLTIHLVPQVIGPTPSEDDRPVLSRIAEALAPLDCVLESPPRDVTAALSLYGSFDFVLATRLHSALLSICAGTPAAVFGYVGGKARGAVEDLMLPEWVTTSTIDDIPGMATRCYERRGELRSLADAGVSAARSRLTALRLPDLGRSRGSERS
jgi:polysaccharide pyruvyl transferase WcaK-like protein